MTIIELVDKGVLDVADGVVFPLNFQAQDVLEPEKKSSNFSKNIKLVGSKNNNELLGFLFDINVESLSFDVNKLVECNVIQNGVNVFDTANFQLLSVDENPNGEIVYTGRVTSKTTDFFTKIKGKELRDLKLPVYGKPLTKPNITGSFSNTESDYFKFIVHPNTLDTPVFLVQDFKPAIFLKTYFDAIHNMAGFSYSFDEWEDLNFDKLLIPTTNKIEADAELEESNNVLYQNASSNDYPVNDNSLSSIIDFGIMQVDNHSQYNNATSVYTPNVNSRLVMEIDANVMFKMEFTGNGGKVQDGNIKYGIQIVIESNNYTSNIIDMFNFTGVVPAGNHTPFTNNCLFSIPITAIQGVPFSDIKIKLVKSGSGHWVDQVLNTVINPVKTIELFTVGMRTLNDMSYQYLSPVFLDDFIPEKVKQSEFIKSLCKMFNMVILTNPDKPTEVKYITRDKWYDEGREVDWTEKVDLSKSITKEWIQDKQPKKINLKYKDGDDATNKVYQDNFEQSYGAYEFTFENEFNTEEKDDEVIFSPTPTVYNKYSNMYLPSVPDGKSNIRILHDNGEKTDGYFYIRESANDNGSLLTNYAQALHTNDAQYPTFDLNFGIALMYFYQFQRPTENNLFNLYHLRKFSQLSNGRIVSMSFLLNEIDVNNLELNQRVWVKDTMYNINKITDYNANGKQTTKVELITIDDGQRLDKNRLIGSIGATPSLPFLPNNPIINIGIKGVISNKIDFGNNGISGNTGVIIGRGNTIADDFRGVIIGDNQNIGGGNGIIIDGVDLIGAIDDLRNEIKEIKTFNNPFIMEVESDGNGEFTIPTTGGGYNYNVRTSNGQTFYNQTGNLTITFPSPNTRYDVEISGDFPRIFFNNGSERLKIRDIKQWGDIVWGASQMFAFYGCEDMIVSATDAPDLSNITDMTGMFASCSSITSLDVSNWDVSSVTSMGSLFYNCTRLTSLDVSNWNTGLVTNMSQILNGCTQLATLDVSNWDVSSVTNMSEMLRDCTSLTTLDVSNWDVSNVLDFDGWLLFSGVQSDIDFSDPITGSISATNTNNMVSFTGVKSLKLQTGSVTNNPNPNEYAGTGMYELILIGQQAPINIRQVPSTLIGTGIDNLADSVADMTGQPSPSVTMTTAQRGSGIDETLWTNKNWTIIEV